MCDCGRPHSPQIFSPLTAAAPAPHTRRQWLRGLAASAALGTVLGPRAWADNPAPSAPRPSAQEALQLLQQGNDRYAQGNTRLRAPTQGRSERTRGQWPYAAILSCADSRVPPELVFDAAEGDLFVVRLAGNFASTEALASLEYAVHVLQVPLLMVMGHSHCGAIAATVHMLQSGASLPGHLPSLTQAIAPALSPLPPLPAEGDAAQRMAQATVLNVQHNVRNLHTASTLLRPKLANGQLHIQGSVLDIASGRVNWL